jgi:hypothetical protein
MSPKQGPPNYLVKVEASLTFNPMSQWDMVVCWVQQLEIVWPVPIQTTTPKKIV